MFFYTIFKVPLSLHTEPEGRPAEDVGMFLIDRLFTNVAQERSLVILDPIIKESEQEATFIPPPNIPEFAPLDVLQTPPPTKL